MGRCSQWKRAGYQYIYIIIPFLFIFITEDKHAHYKHIRKHNLKFFLTTNVPPKMLTFWSIIFFPQYICAMINNIFSIVLNFLFWNNFSLWEQLKAFQYRVLDTLINRLNFLTILAYYVTSLCFLKLKKLTFCHILWIVINIVFSDFPGG